MFICLSCILFFLALTQPRTWPSHTLTHPLSPLSWMTALCWQKQLGWRRHMQQVSLYSFKTYNTLLITAKCAGLWVVLVMFISFVFFSFDPGTRTDWNEDLLTTAGLHQKIRQVVAVGKVYFVASEYLACRRCKHKIISLRCGEHQKVC